MKNRIKNILKTIALVSFAMFQFFGCKQIEDLKDSEKVAYITINNSLARTAMPELSIEKMTNFLLKGTFSGEEEQELGTWDNAKSLKTAKILIKPGLWDFKLTSQQGGVSFSATIEKKQIEVALNNLEFNLSVSSMDLQNGKGSINISFTELKNTLASVTAEFFYLDRTSTNLSKADLLVEPTDENSNAVLSKTDVPSGTYLIDFVFYSDAEKTVKLGTYTELVNVTANCTSSAVIKNLDLANLYKITYDLSGGNFSDGFTAPASYSSCSSIELPLEAKVIKSGYVFLGWYTESNTPITTISLGSTGNIKLVAKWKCSTADFRVNHYQQNIKDDDYTLFETEVFTGTTESITTASAKTYTGFTTKDFEQKQIQGDGQTVVDIYYDRKLITITFNKKVYDFYSNEYISELKGKYGDIARCETSEEDDPYTYRYYLTAGKFIENTTIIPVLMAKKNAVDVDYYYYEGYQNRVNKKIKLDSFYIAQTETTYGKWREVYKWAIDDERVNKYDFYYTDSCYKDYQPITCKAGDIIVWCNAISEKEGLSPVYLRDDNKEPIRSHDFIEKNYSSILVDENADGYRIPTAEEWDYATYFIKYIDSYGIERVDMYENGAGFSSTFSTNTIYNTSDAEYVPGAHKPNYNGLYDCIGNVSELVYLGNFTQFGSYGCDYSATKEDCKRGSAASTKKIKIYNYTGFRLARSVIE